MTTKKILKNLGLWLCLGLVPALLWGQNNSGTTQLLPTGRSFPDVLPTDEFIYTGIADDLARPNVDSPQTPPAPNSNPITTPNDSPTFPQRADSTDPVDFAPPNNSASIPPKSIVAYPHTNPVFIPEQDPDAEIATDAKKPNEGKFTPSTEQEPQETMRKNSIDGAPRSLALIPPSEVIAPVEQPQYPPDDDITLGPTEQITIAPTNDPLYPPSNSAIPPGDSITIGPDGIIPPGDAIAIGPDGIIPPGGAIAIGPDGIIPPGGAIAISPDGTIPPGDAIAMGPDGSIPAIDDIIPPNPSGLTITEGEEESGVYQWRFTLNPTTDKYAEKDDIIEETTVEEPRVQVVAPVTQNDAQIANDSPQDLITSLHGRYIQVSSYNQLGMAQQEARKVRSRLAHSLQNNVHVYKSADSAYYKVVVGPFQITEIGVNLYTIRRKGYSDAYTIK